MLKIAENVRKMACMQISLIELKTIKNQTTKRELAIDMRLPNSRKILKNSCGKNMMTSSC